MAKWPKGALNRLATFLEAKMLVSGLKWTLFGLFLNGTSLFRPFWPFSGPGRPGTVFWLGLKRVQKGSQKRSLLEGLLRAYRRSYVF